MRLLDVKRFFDNFAVLILPRPNYFLTHPIKMQNFKVVLPQVFWVSIDPEVLRAHSQKSPFSYSAIVVIGEKYQRPLLKRLFSKS